jgi:hypothetical protein
VENSGGDIAMESGHPIPTDDDLTFMSAQAHLRPRQTDSTQIPIRAMTTDSNTLQDRNVTSPDESALGQTYIFHNLPSETWKPISRQSGSLGTGYEDPKKPTSLQRGLRLADDNPVEGDTPTKTFPMNLKYGLYSRSQARLAAMGSPSETANKNSSQLDSEKDPKSRGG